MQIQTKIHSNDYLVMVDIHALLDTTQLNEVQEHIRQLESMNAILVPLDIIALQNQQLQLLVQLISITLFLDQHQVLLE